MGTNGVRHLLQARAAISPKSLRPVSARDRDGNDPSQFADELNLRSAHDQFPQPIDNVATHVRFVKYIIRILILIMHLTKVCDLPRYTAKGADVMSDHQNALWITATRIGYPGDRKIGADFS